MHNTLGIGFPPDGIPNEEPYFGPPPFANRGQSYLDLADLMSQMWVTFIHDGNPNFDGREFDFLTGAIAVFG